MTGAGGGAAERKGGERKQKVFCNSVGRTTFGANQLQLHLAKELAPDSRALGRD